VIKFHPGRLRPVPGQPRLRLAPFLTAEARPHPAVSVDWLSRVSEWPMYANDRMGCCTIATVGHAIQSTSTYGQGATITVPERSVVAKYAQLSGYDPATGANDTGLVVQHVLNDWRKNGLDGHKALMFAEVDHRDRAEILTAIGLFGWVYLGIDFPDTAMDQFNRGERWEVVPGARLEGGHAIPAGAYTSSGYQVVTWGRLQEMSNEFFERYCVAPDTRVLTHDLRWIRAGDVLAGDQLLGFDEEARDASQEGYKRRGRLYRSTRVEKIEIVEQPCYDLEFDDGTKVRCSANHKWLVGGNQGARWMETEHLSLKRNQASRVIKPLEVWETQNSREAGYLAAAFDGEGCLIQRDLRQQSKGTIGTILSFSQRDNEMLAEVERCLKELDFIFGRGLAGGGTNKNVFKINLSRRSEVLKFLGSIRPSRLMAKFQPDRLGMINHKTVRLVKKTFVGIQLVVAMQTDAHTFLAEGLASHNCEEAWVVVTPEWLSAVGVTPTGLDLYGLGEEFSRLTGEPNPIPAASTTPPAAEPWRAVKSLLAALWRLIAGWRK
jgi:hypothetical protein